MNTKICMKFICFKHCDVQINAIFIFFLKKDSHELLCNGQHFHYLTVKGLF